MNFEEEVRLYKFIEEQPKETKMPKEAARFNEGKPRLSYFRRSFRKMVEGIAWVKTFGANKYEEDNWRIGGKPDTEYWDSMDRHIDLFVGGEVYDQDSGCHHLAHACWNLCALLELNYPDVPMRDVEIYEMRMAHWAKVKADGGQVSTFSGDFIEPKLIDTARKIRVTQRNGQWNVYENAHTANGYVPPCASEILIACRNKDNGNDNWMGTYKFQFQDEVTE